MDFDAIRAQYNLRNEVEKDLGAPVKSTGKWTFWRCPFHSERDASFAVAGDTFRCFGCEKHGDIVDWMTGFRGLDLDQVARAAGADDVEARLRRLEYQQREHERRIAEHEKRLTALERIHNCTDHLRYHRQMPEAAREYWYNAGMLPETIDKYQLGYCQRCPTDDQGRASYTIPVMSNGQLWNIRHRLANADNGDKYRPHIAGLPVVLFNADYLRDADGDSILIVEGEKKSIIAAQWGIANVGVMGKSGFDEAWVMKFDRFKRVNVCYDPDATDKAAKVAALFEDRGRVVTMPGKLDDLVAIYGALPEDLLAFISLGRKP